ncbi:hypothetical protein LCGC14_2112330 [marine sediment metagenome]|uniref:Uncharacterized protein n=1 Tax=marine sediment metagenome TaxID=412755 RepID=A0A0F9H2Z8_9ZZZZ
MRRMLSIALFVSLLSSMASGNPILGLCESPTAGNDLLSGMWSESFVGGGEGQIGNTIRAASWNGANPDDEWVLDGPAIDAAPVKIVDTLDAGGNGVKVYFTTCSGGTLTLVEDGPWWDPNDAPDVSYIVNIGSCNHATTMVFVGGVRTTCTTTVYLRGDVSDYPSHSVSFLQAAAIPHGQGALCRQSATPTSLTPGWAHGVRCRESAWKLFPSRPPLHCWVWAAAG